MLGDGTMGNGGLLIVYIILWEKFFSYVTKKKGRHNVPDKTIEMEGGGRCSVQTFRSHFDLFHLSRRHTYVAISIYYNNISDLGYSLV